MRTILASTAITLALTAGLASAPQAQARQHGRWVSVQGPWGHGYTRSRSVSRHPGDVTVNRSFQTRSGRGIASQRDANWGDGRYQGGATHRLNDGRTFGRSTSIVKNGDGSYSYDFSRNGLNGRSRSASGTVTRPPR